MVLERDIPSCSPRGVLIRYIRGSLIWWDHPQTGGNFFIAIFQQVQNGIDSDCISFRLENLIDLLLRSAHLYQDGGQALAVVRAAFTTVENWRQSLWLPFWTCCNISIRARLTIGDKVSWDTSPKSRLFYVLSTSKGGNIAFLPHPLRTMLGPCSSYL